MSPSSYPILAAAGYLAARLPWLPRWLEDHDSVNFALALDRFDLQAHRPHFPGYPMYLALAKAPHALGIAAPAALALPAVVAGAVACAVLFATVRPRLGLAAAVAGAAVYAFLPGVWLADLTPRSDALGFHALTLAACGVLQGERRWRGAVAFGLGLTLGVRASLLPAVAGLWLVGAWPLDGRGRARWLAWMFAGVAVWLAPLVGLAGGPVAFGDLGLRFVYGHLYDWGGTVAAAHAGAGGQRAADLAWNVAGWLLGPLGVAMAGLALVLWPFLRRCESEFLRNAEVLVLALLPYAAWTALGQNADHARHVLPLALPVAIAGAAVVAALLHGRARRFAVQAALAFAVAGLVADSWPRVHAQATTPSPAVQAGVWVSQQNPEQLRVFAGSETGVLQFLAPAHRVERARDLGDLRQRRTAAAVPRRDWFTSSVPGAACLQTRVVAAFSGRQGVDRPDARCAVLALETTAPVQTAEAAR